MKQLILLALIALVIVSAAAWPQSRKEPSKPKVLHTSFLAIYLNIQLRN